MNKKFYTYGLFIIPFLLLPMFLNAAGENDYFDSLCARGDIYKCESLRSQSKLVSFGANYINSYDGLPIWSYNPAADTNSQKQDAAKVRFPAFVAMDRNVTTAILASTPGAIEQITISDARNVTQGKVMKIDNEIMVCLNPDTSSSLCGVSKGVSVTTIWVMRGAYGTAAEAHTVGTPIYTNVNSLLDMLFIPMNTDPINTTTYLVTIDTYFTNSMAGMGESGNCSGVFSFANSSACSQSGGGYKGWQFRVNSDAIFMETKPSTALDGSCCVPTGWNKLTDVSGISLRNYSVLGPPFYKADYIRPMTNKEFIIKPGKWMRLFWVIESNGLTDSFGRLSDITAPLTNSSSDTVISIDYTGLPPGSGGNNIIWSNNETGRRLKVGSEIMTIQNCTTSGNPITCNVTRATDGTTISSHSVGDDVELNWDYFSIYAADEDHEPILLYDRVPSYIPFLSPGQPGFIKNFNFEFNDSQDRLIQHRATINWADMVLYTRNFAMLKKSGTGGFGGGGLPSEWAPLVVRPSPGAVSVIIPDTTLPTISLTSPGTTVSGTVTLSATATDNVGVTGVQFKLDGNNLGSEDTSSPYSTSWNTTTATNASHTLTATARDAAGNTKTSSSVTVTVSNTVVTPNPQPSDTTPPVISTITASSITTSGATISWTTNENTTSTLYYGLTTAYGSSLVSGGTTSHTLNLTSLTPNTVYNYIVVSRDSSNNTSTSTNRTLTTLAGAVTPTPTPQPTPQPTPTPTPVTPTPLPTPQPTPVPTPQPTPVPTPTPAGGGGGSSGTPEVTNLRAEPGTGEVKLMWSNPSTSFTKVYLIRTTNGVNGVIYEGSVEEWIDTNLKNGITYTYSIRVEDTQGKLHYGPTITTTPFGNLSPVVTPSPQPTPTPSRPTPQPVTPQPQPTPGSNTSSITRTLSLGTSGGDVTTLQNILIQKGYLSPGNNSGYFGYLTRQAVQKLQCEKLSVCSGDESSTGYGLVGTRTKTLVTTGTVVPITTTPIGPTPQPITPTTTLIRTLYIGLTGTDVITLQNYLILKGYLTLGNNTGYFGPLTRSAVQRFQCDRLAICSGSESTTGWGTVGARTRGEVGR